MAPVVATYAGVKFPGAPLFRANAAFKAPNCRQGHELLITICQVGSQICDSCQQYIRSTFTHRCRTCDFDLCRRCFAAGQVAKQRHELSRTGAATAEELTPSKLNFQGFCITASSPETRQLQKPSSAPPGTRMGRKNNFQHLYGKQAAVQLHPRFGSRPTTAPCAAEQRRVLHHAGLKQDAGNSGGRSASPVQSESAQLATGTSDEPKTPETTQEFLESTTDPIDCSPTIPHVTVQDAVAQLKTRSNSSPSSAYRFRAAIATSVALQMACPRMPQASRRRIPF